MDRKKVVDGDALSTDQLRNALKRCAVTAAYFVGVFPLDKLPRQRIDSRPALIICNTAYSQSGGEHWVAFYLNKNFVDYFDSYGLPPRGEHLLNFISVNGGSTASYTFNKTPLQSLNATTCGKFAATYLYFRTLGYTTDQYTNLLANHSDSKVRQLYACIFHNVCSGGSLTAQKCYKYTRHCRISRISP